MSDIIYRIIPEDHTFFPEDIERISGAAQILESYCKEAQITASIFEEVSFIDCGELLEEIYCPICRERIEIDQWQKLMNDSYEKSRFENLKITLPCCGDESTLNDLIYKEECAFARFSIDVMNPKYAPCGVELFEASKCFGRLRLKMIRAEY